MNTRAKLVCVQVDQQYSDNECANKIAENVKFETRYNNADSKEDNSFSEFTPLANYCMSVTNAALFGSFIEGNAYYFDITPCAE